MSVFLDERGIGDIVYDLSTQINSIYSSKHEPVGVLVLMNGGFMFAADLVRRLEFEIEMKFISISSYGNETSSSESATINSNIPEFSKNISNLLILDDIWDTGNTARYVVEMFRHRFPQNIRVCCFARREGSIDNSHIDPITGIWIKGQDFLYGYGMDLSGLYRNLPRIYTK